MSRSRTPEQIQRMALRVAKLRGRSRHEHALVLADAMEEVGWPSYPNVVPTGRAGRPEVWDVQTLDVWGNAEDGWEINNWYRAGEVRIPTKEFVYNVKAYANEYAKGYRETGQGRPLLRTISVDHVHDEGTFERIIRKRFFRSNISKRTLRFDSAAEDWVEVSRVRDGKPLLHLHRSYLHLRTPRYFAQNR